MTVDETLDDRIRAMSCPVEHSMFDPEIQNEPWDFYDELRASCPVYPMPDMGAVLVSRYDDVRFVLTNPELFSSSGQGGKRKRGLRAEHARRYHEILAVRGWAHVETLQRTDPPVHSGYRSLVAKAFLPRRIKMLASHIDEVTNDLLDGLLGSPGETTECEFHMGFAMPLPGTIIAEELGLDRSEIHRFNRWADAMLAVSMRVLTDDELLEAAETELEAQHHLAAEFERRRTDPTDDLISVLVHAHEDEDGAEPLSVGELQNLMHQLVTGGFETTTSALDHGMWLLTRRPDVQARVRADLSLVPAFVEEVLRYESPVAGLVRRATQDVELNGVVIPKGAMVMARYQAANRDSSAFDRPEEFDLDRHLATGEDRDRPHLAFGVGPHFCVGAALARQELVSAFTAWLQRTSNIELARPFDGPAHDPSFMLFPMKELPLRMTAVGSTLS
jgi:cytochrome P450